MPRLHLVSVGCLPERRVTLRVSSWSCWAEAVGTVTGGRAVAAGTAATVAPRGGDLSGEEVGTVSGRVMQSEK